MRSVVLSGFMATGKSTVARHLAERLQLPLVDTDAEISLQTGMPTGQLFLSEGEARFRDREAALILPLLEDRIARVIAFGGGAVTVPRIRHAALEHATVITLSSSPETIASRAGAIAPVDRPNLGAASPLERARDLLSLRAEAYGECHVTLSSENTTPELLADRIAQIAKRDLVAVPLGRRSYVVELVDGDPGALNRILRELEPSSIIVVTDDNVLAARGAWLDTALAPLPTPQQRIVLTPGEEHKTIASINAIWDAALGQGLDRRAVVIAFGGGVVGDLAGFAASTLLRGVRCVQVPTTLLSMVDSSVGGKTGFDHAAGKNLLGAFFQPSHVLIDVEHLTTLPERQHAAGLAEIVKIALVRNATLLERLEQIAPSLVTAADRDALRAVIRSAVIEKMRVVREDEHETGVRGLLNLGHTIGHALESHGGYSRWLHGEAVAIGTVLELAVTERLGHTPPGTSERAAQLLVRLGLPTTVPMSDVEAAWPFVSADKKRAGAAIKLPVVTGPGVAHIERIAISELKAAVLACPH